MERRATLRAAGSSVVAFEMKAVMSIEAVFVEGVPTLRERAQCQLFVHDGYDDGFHAYGALVNSRRGYDFLGDSFCFLGR